jgi:hypothetical protein
MNWLSNFVPTALLIPFLMYAFVKHEVAEWAHERSNGLQGSSATFGMFVDATSLIGTCTMYVFLIAYGYDQNWQKAVGLYAASILIGAVDQFVPVIIRRTSDKWFLFFRLACIAAFYAMLVYLSFQFSWFGFWK